MGNILNPTENNSFIKLVKFKDSEIFVDKTDFIEKISAKVNTQNCFLAITRPRRFGKTVTAHMLLAYYSKGYARQDIFDKLEIANKPSYSEHLNKYNVIYIDMNSIKDQYISYKADSSLYIEAIDDIVDFLQYMIVQELKDNKEYAEQINNAPLVGKKSLSSALQVICKYTGEKFIFIMDEWDLICREYRNEPELLEKFIEVMRGLFKSDKGQACFALAYLTGILPIKKYNSQSALNVFKEYNMLRPVPYEEYFGFTEEEVAEIVKLPQCKISHQELKEWYEGYKLNGKDIYNPNSVVSAISDGICQSYWSGTSSNEEVVRLINMNFRGIKNDITKLIDGIKIPFNSNNFQNDMVTIKDKNDIFSLLVCLGYLGCSERNNGLKLAYVPNQEIKQTLLSIVRCQKWSRRTEIVKRSEMLLNSIIKKPDENKVAEIIQEIHNSTAVSLLDYNDEESLTYCVMTGLLWSTLDDYNYHREDQAGKGRVDLVYEPITDKLPLILIEFKYDSSAEEAINQIKTKEYFKRYTRQYHNTVIVGINYSTKTKDHQCMIEKLD
ncbi:MAG: AAA family ATPase [Ruminobacter sp.]|nr:AAA family ATPase [Ruminobacter sp.]